jgi:mRNA interferase MazF
MYNQYEIVIADFDPTVGSDIKKVRPCVILSPNEMNHSIQTLIVAPMTSKSRDYPTRVGVKHNGTEGWIVLDQIRTIDKQRVIKKVGKLSEAETNQCRKVIKEMLFD